MMEFVCYSKREELGVVSSDGLLQAFIKMWILEKLKRSGFSISGFRVFLFYGESRIGISENENQNVRVWSDGKKETLILVNQTGTVWIHKTQKMDPFHPAKEEEVIRAVKKRMGIKIKQEKSDEKKEDTNI